MRSPPRIRVGAASLFGLVPALAPRPGLTRSAGWLGYRLLAGGGFTRSRARRGMLGYRKDMSTSYAAFALLATLPSPSVAGPAPPCTPSSGAYSLSPLLFCWLASVPRNGGAKTTRSRISGCHLRTARTRRAHRRHLPMLRDNPSTGTLRRFSLRRRRTSRASPSGVPSAIRSSTCRIRSPRVTRRVPPRLTTHSRTVLRAPR